MFLFLLMHYFSAFASGGSSGSDDGESMIFLLSVILMLSFAYILTHFVVTKLQNRFLFISGFEYILLGLGLSLTTLYSDHQKILPVLILSVGYFGLVQGIHGGIQKIFTGLEGGFRLAIIESIFTLAFISTIGAKAIEIIIPNLQSNENWYVGVMLGCSAIGGSTSVSELLQDKFPHIKSSIYTIIFQSTKISNIIAILTFGSLVCVSYSFHSSEAMSTPSVMGWVTLGLGLGLGLLFSMFLDKTSDENSDFLAVTGITCLTAGAAAFLHVAVITVTFFLGITLSYTRKAADLITALGRSRRPMRLLLLVISGALFVPIDIIRGSLFCVGYVFLRWIAKAIGGYIATIGTNMRIDIFRALLAQGEISLCIAVSGQMLFHSPATNMVFAAILLSVAVSEFFGPRILKGLLIDNGDLNSTLNTNQSEMK